MSGHRKQVLWILVLIMLKILGTSNACTILIDNSHGNGTYGSGTLEEQLSNFIDVMEDYGNEAFWGTIDTCIFSYDVRECPAGWSRNNDFEDRTIRSTNIELLGDGTYSAGSQVLAVDGGIGGFDEIPIACGGECGAEGGTLYYWYTFDNWPPYANVLVFCKE